VDKGVGNSLGTSFDQSWEQVLDRVAERAGPDDPRDLIRRLRPRALTTTELRLEAPDKVTLVYIRDNYLGPLREAVSTVLGHRQVVIDLPKRDQGELFPEAVRHRGDQRARESESNLQPRYTFANFVVGASNQFAHAASKAVATLPGDHYNPLFIYGSAGLGKTHLANAIGHEILERHPAARLAYLSSEAFMNDLIRSLRRYRMAEFKERFRRVDVLILEDVHLLGGRERTQEEFFHTFNTLHDERRQIVLTSATLPRDIRGLEERLRNRFEWGLIADIQPPDVETRVAILERKAEADGIPLPHEVALFLATRVTSNVRDLEASLTRLGAQASLTRRPISEEFAQEVLRPLLRPDHSSITFEAIANTVCEHYSLRPADLRSKRRSRNVAQPRQLAMYLCRRLLNASFPHIGELFGRDHSTVIHATAVTERRLKEDSSFHATVERIERAIRGQ